jgi:ribosomal protein RSM22 (predicted rRNA methylase)
LLVMSNPRKDVCLDLCTQRGNSMARTQDEQSGKHPRPEEARRLSVPLRSLLDREIARLPNGDVSEHETRYPVDAAGIRAFLSTFFTRHLFQLQNSLLDYMASRTFSGTREVDSLRILDVGSGPAVASLALMDIAENLRETGMGADFQHEALLSRTVHVLNDTSAVCLATGKHMRAEYLRRKQNRPFTLGGPRILTLQSPFPGNLHQLRRMASALGGYDIVFLSYVVHPVTETCGLQGFAQAVRTLGDLCRPTGRVLIIQDKFQESVLRELAQMLGIDCREQTVAQEIYPPRGENDTYTYTYYDCLYVPCPADGARYLKATISSR